MAAPPPVKGKAGTRLPREGNSRTQRNADGEGRAWGLSYPKHGLILLKINQAPSKHRTIDGMLPARNPGFPAGAVPGGHRDALITPTSLPSFLGSVRSCLNGVEGVFQIRDTITKLEHALGAHGGGGVTATDSVCYCFCHLKLFAAETGIR